MEPQVLDGKVDGRHLMLTTDKGELRLVYAGGEFIASMSNMNSLRALRNRIDKLLDWHRPGKLL